jgi:hypothetical protein
MFYSKNLNLTVLLLFLPLLLNSCGTGVDARKFPPEPEKRVQKNIEEGRGFRLMDKVKKGGNTYEFASSNELWRASLGHCRFYATMASVNYSGGIYNN